MQNKLKIIGLSGAIGVTLGALGAHFLKAKMQLGIITVDQLDGFDKGVKYQMYHTIAMLGIILLNQHVKHKFLEWSYAFFFWGIILFSGSLYFLCTRNLFGAEWLKVLGPITPIGGVFFIIGWVLILVTGFKLKK